MEEIEDRRALDLREGLGRTVARHRPAGRGPLARPRASRPPRARSLRHSVMWLLYRPSRRMTAPLAPGAVAWSTSSRIATLYAALKRRRIGHSGTSGSGIRSIGEGCTPDLGSAAEIAMSGNLGPCPRSVKRGCGVSHPMLAERVGIAASRRPAGGLHCSARGHAVHGQILSCLGASTVRARRAHRHEGVKRWLRHRAARA